MWNTDLSLARLVIHDQRAWEGELDRLQRIGWIDAARPVVAPARAWAALGAIGRIKAALGQLGMPRTAVAR